MFESQAEYTVEKYNWLLYHDYNLCDMRSFVADN